MRRRRFIGGIGGIAVLGLSGCSDTQPPNETETQVDSDGDGVPDKHDYAPRDPDVQSKSDVVTATSSRTSTPTQTSRSTRSTSADPYVDPITTPIPTPTQTPTRSSTNTVQADSEPLEGIIHHPVEYSAKHATVRIYGELLDNSYPDGAELVAHAQGYPDTSRSDDFFGMGRSDSFSPSMRGETTISVEFDESVSSNVPIFYWFVLVPTGEEVSSLSGDDVDYLCQTDRIRERSGDVTRASHPDLPGDDTANSRYQRHSAEGCYMLEFSGESYRQSWNADFTVFKHGYIEDLNDRRYNDRRDYVYEALNEGLADELGNILNEEAEANGITGDRQKVEFLIDFVQNLPYIPDDVSTGYDDYTKRHIETLVDGGGDCEDSAIMLASLLSSESFGYGTALILPPGHAALGVKGGDDLDGYYYEQDGTRYYYIETTGRGWDVGEIPDEYRGEEAYIRVI
jgi:hypothetical protein